MILNHAVGHLVCQASDLNDATSHKGLPAYINEVLAQAITHPMRIAVSLPHREVTYGEIYAMAMALAADLRRRGDTTALRLAIVASQSLTFYVGVWAALLADMSFVPMSPTAPWRRLAHLLHLVQPAAVLVEPMAVRSVREALGRSESPGYSDHALFLLDENIEASNTHETEQYVVFASGSTGEPRAMPITRQNLDAFVAYNQTRYNFTSGLRFTQFFASSFDLATFDLLMPWTCGACVCAPGLADVFDPERFVQERDIDVWFSVPSQVDMYVQRGLLRPGSLDLRWALFCGEPLLERTARAFHLAAPRATIENILGRPRPALPSASVDTLVHIT